MFSQGALGGKRVLMTKTKNNIRRLTYGAICIALSFVLSCFVCFKMPNDGTITLGSMLPIAMFSYWFGPVYGILSGVVFGLLQFVQSPYFLSWPQFFCDYIWAFAGYGLVGFFGAHSPFGLGEDGLKERPLFAGIVVAGLSRLVAATVSGAVFFAEYCWEGWSVWPYSLVYNMSYIIPDVAICILILCLPVVRKTLNKIMPKNLKGQDKEIES